MQLSDKAAQALYSATIKKGASKGMLLKNAPKDNLARAAWYGAQIICNPYKVSIYAVMFFTDEERAIYREIEALMEEWKAKTKGAIVALDQDRATLEKLGVW